MCTFSCKITSLFEYFHFPLLPFLPELILSYHKPYKIPPFNTFYLNCQSCLMRVEEGVDPTHSTILQTAALTALSCFFSPPSFLPFFPRFSSLPSIPNFSLFAYCLFQLWNILSLYIMTVSSLAASFLLFGCIAQFVKTFPHRLLQAQHSPTMISVFPFGSL